MERRRSELLVPRAFAEEKLRGQITIGERLRSMRITSKLALRNAEAEKERWTDFNIELMIHLFSEIQYSNRYQKFHSSVYSPSWTLKQEVSLFRDVVAEENNQLKSDLEKLSLIPESKSVSDSAKPQTFVQSAGTPGSPTTPGKKKAVLDSGDKKATEPQLTTNNFFGTVGNVAQSGSRMIDQSVQVRKIGLAGNNREKLATIGILATILALPAAWLSVPGFQHWAKSVFGGASRQDHRLDAPAEPTTKFMLTIHGNPDIAIPTGMPNDSLIVLTTTVWNIGKPSYATRWSLKVTPPNGTPVTVDSIPLNPAGLRVTGKVGSFALAQSQDIGITTKHTKITETPTDGCLRFIVPLKQTVVDHSAMELSVMDSTGSEFRTKFTPN